MLYPELVSISLSADRAERDSQYSLRDSQRAAKRRQHSLAVARPAGWRAQVRRALRVVRPLGSRRVAAAT